MNDPLLVSVCESSQNLGSNVESLSDPQNTSLLQKQVERLALDVLHCQIGDPALFVSCLVESGDVGMIERARHLGLTLQSGEELTIAGGLIEVVRGELDGFEGYAASNATISCQINGPHRSMAEDGFHVVKAEAAAREGHLMDFRIWSRAIRA